MSAPKKPTKATNKNMKSGKQKNIVWGLSALVLLLAIIGTLTFLNYGTPEQRLTEEQKAAIHAASIEGRFETVLNDFLQNVDGRTKAYKERRKILQDLVKTDNLRSPVYIAENFAIASDMVPEMNADINAILTEFENTDARIKTLVQDESINNQDVILERWEEVKNKQAKTYIDYFAFEQELLERNLRLLEIYNEGRESAQIVPANGDIQIQLDDARLQKRVDIILEDIQSLAKAQRAALN